MPKNRSDEGVSHDLISRWGGDPLLLSEGFLAVPRTFIKYRHLMRPKLTPTESMFILELMLHKWDQKAPFPGYKTLAQRLGVSEPYARKIARTLQQKKYLQRIARVGQTNRFDLTPLFEKLAERVKKEQMRRKKKGGDETVEP